MEESDGTLVAYDICAIGQTCTGRPSSFGGALPLKQTPKKFNIVI